MVQPKQKAMTQINGYLIVPVPEGANGFITASPGTYGVGGEHYNGCLGFNTTNPDSPFEEIALPDGDWSIVEIDERVAGEIVDVFECIVDGELEDRSFLDYAVTGSFFPTALESYSSLLRSKGYEKAILLKKK
jgi:hypothetical protein